MRKTPRKTAAEVRAEERTLGFYQCLQILEDEWRSQVRMTSRGPVGGEKLWPLVEKMQAHAGLLDDDHKELALPRQYGTEFKRLRRRVILLKPHPHAGRKGFVLDSPAFEENGLWRVYFLDKKAKADIAFAKPEHWRFL